MIYTIFYFIVVAGIYYFIVRHRYLSSSSPEEWRNIEEREDVEWVAIAGFWPVAILALIIYYLFEALDKLIES